MAAQDEGEWYRKAKTWAGSVHDEMDCGRARAALRYVVVYPNVTGRIKDARVGFLGTANVKP